MISRRGDRVCTSINFNFRALYEVEIRFSDNPQQNETIGSIIWLMRKKCVIYRLDIIFIITHVVQLMVSKINFFCQRDICRYPGDLQREICRLFVCDTQLRCPEKLQFMFTETRQISKLRNQDVSMEILSGLLRKDVAELSNKFSHFHYATLKMFKAALNNYSRLKLINNFNFAMYYKNVSHQYYVTNQDTKPHILSWNCPKIGVDQCLSFFLLQFLLLRSFFSIER